jgi:conjugal transfer pilus assembly protein TraK
MKPYHVSGLLAVLALGLVTLQPAAAQQSPVPGLPVEPVQQHASDTRPNATDDDIGKTGGRDAYGRSQSERAAEQDAHARALRQLVGQAQAQLGDVQGISPATQITVKPGINEILPISLGHLNRLVTPFPHPLIKTTSQAQTDTQGSIVYVATNASSPITLFVMDKSDPANAISLTLLPKRIPPVQTKLILKGWEPPIQAIDAPVAKRVEAGQPFVESLKTIMRALAKQKIPDGFGYKAIHDDPLMPTCIVPGIRIQPAQRLTGSRTIAFVAKATNRSRTPIDMDESGCAAPNVLAVAAWPRHHLMPGEKTELYILVRMPEPGQGGRERPSLVGGGI